MPRAEIRYVRIPTADVGASARFYERTLGWTIRTRDDGSTAFDDTTAEVSGEWVLDRQPAGDAGVLLYIRVDDVEAILQKIVDAEGEIIVPRTPQGEGIAYATFRDPAGNVLGIFQEHASWGGRSPTLSTTRGGDRHRGATQSSGEDDALSLVHHLDGTWPTSAYQAIDDRRAGYG